MHKENFVEVSEENIFGHEIIGLGAEIALSSDLGMRGISGKVIDETMKTIKIETNAGEKIVPKKGTSFVFEINNNKVNVLGKDLLARPEDRTKIWWRKYHGRM